AAPTAAGGAGGGGAATTGPPSEGRTVATRGATGAGAWLAEDAVALRIRSFMPSSSSSNSVISFSSRIWRISLSSLRSNALLRLGFRARSDRENPIIPLALAGCQGADGRSRGEAERV